MIFSELLKQIPQIHHGFGTREALPEGLAPWRAKQVHSDRIVELESDKAVAATESIEADAIITARKAEPIGIQTADCLPIIMVASDIGYIAAIHAGWRGTVEQITKKVIEVLTVEKGAEVSKVCVAMGPCISARRYEVGEDVASAFVGAGFPRPQKNNNGKYLLDLTAANQSDLLEAGIPAENIDVIELCTYEREDLFYSYRRDGEGTGRQVSWIEVV
jgi:YfiH family protein